MSAMPWPASRLSLTAALLLSGVSTAAVAQPRLAVWRATELWRVDGTDAGDGFGDVRDAVTLANGDLWILDFKDQQIRRYDSSGKPLPATGRKGAGPGELRNANGMLVQRDGTVWVNDPHNGRFTVFGADGKFVRQHPIAITGYGYRWEAWLDASTGHVMDAVTRTRGETRVAAWRRVSATGNEAGDMDVPTCGTPEFRTTSYQAETKGKGNTIGTYPFMSGGGKAPNGTGAMWCAGPGSRRVALVRIGKNDTLATTTIDVPPLAVAPVERDAAIARIVASTKQYATSDFDPARVPRTKPGIAALHVDGDGRLWVQHGARFGVQSTVYDVHDARGAHLGRVVVPFAVISYLPVRARGNDAWFPAKDADDVVSIVKMRVAR
jgi:hypothetical protein